MHELTSGTKPPEKTPYTITNAIASVACLECDPSSVSVVIVVAGSQRERQHIPANKVVAIMRLNRPYMSDNNADRIRPSVEPPFITDRTYGDIVMSREVYVYSTMNVNGTNTPKCETD